MGGGANLIFEAGLGEVGLQGHGLVARKAGEAEVLVVQVGGLNQPFQAQVAQVIQAQEVPDLVRFPAGRR